MVSWEGNDVLKEMATQLSAMLTTEGKKERGAWEKLHGMLADVATAIADPKNTVPDLLSMLKKEMGSLDLGYQEAEVLLRQIFGFVEEKVSAENADASKGAIPLLKQFILLVAFQLKMTPLRNSFHLDMIKVDTFYEENVDNIIRNSDELSDSNAPYAVLSIVGAQSSGKSYLLNQLFGTNFPVMNAQDGRNQTTQGILMSRCMEPSLLVLDVEGFDGRERGEDISFENQAALFALTVSDLMMVNISVFDIGRQRGGGDSLFKTIFQERSKLPAGLTKIIVVLRFYDGEIPLATMKLDVIKTLEKLWTSVNKESVEFSNYIEINVVGLPDKGMPDFPEKVSGLRDLLSNSATTAKVPVSSFSLSSKMLWAQIKQNERLDIPSHMVLLATLYCQQTVESCIAHFDDVLLKASESPAGFKEISDQLLANIIAQYDQETEMYDAAVRDKERQKMVDRINMVITEDSRELILNIQQNISEQFKVEFVMNLENMEETDDVVNYDEHTVESCIEKFTNSCEDLKVFDPDYFHSVCEDLQKQLTSYTILHIISVNAERARKAVESAEKKSEKVVQELTMKLEHMTQECQQREEEMKRLQEIQKDEKEKRDEEDLKRREQMVEHENNKRVKEEAERKEQMVEQENIKKVKEDLERRELMLEQEKVKMSNEELERKAKMLEIESDMKVRKEVGRKELMLEQESNKRVKEELERREQMLEQEKGKISEHKANVDMERLKLTHDQENNRKDKEDVEHQKIRNEERAKALEQLRRPQGLLGNILGL